MTNLTEKPLPYLEFDTGIVLIGNCLLTLQDIPDCSVDSIVTDPPYEIGFMGRSWDNTGIAYSVELWAECLRVLKPGGHMAAFGATRAAHRMACAIEDAGFEIRDTIHHTYGTGFPKSHNISKAIDREAGAKRTVVGSKRVTPKGVANAEQRTASSAGAFGGEAKDVPVTVAATADAKQWDGYGTALKPSHEFIYVCRKPLVGTVAANVLQYGTGALNIDACRVGTEVTTTTNGKGFSGSFEGGENDNGGAQHTGRWPANTLLTHNHDCELLCTAIVSVTLPSEIAGGIWSPSKGKPAGATYTDEAARWDCTPGCPVLDLDQQSGTSGGGKRKEGVARARNNGIGLGSTDERAGAANSPDNYGDEGGASRFFQQSQWDVQLDQPVAYYAKPSKKERNAGLDGLPEQKSPKNGSGLGRTTSLEKRKEATGHDANVQSNHHPTVKPVALMRHLCRLLTPPGGVVLDPFLGSGTTAVAAVLEGYTWIGCELTDEYLPIIQGRVAHAEKQTTQLELPL